MSKNKTAIIHFAPLELYPPVQNLIREMEKRLLDDVRIFTTHAVGFPLGRFSAISGSIRVFRLGKSGKGLHPIFRYVNYLYFFSGVVIHLLLKRPGRIVYFETMSSFPAYLYKRFVKPEVRIFVHYHEYTSPGEYQRGMKLAKYFYSLEKWIIPRAEWVSHTNQDRMEMFRKDLFPLKEFKAETLPNYPPATWSSQGRAKITLPVQIVYIGALSLTTMYTKEFAEWVLAQEGAVSWDIYSVNCTDEARKFISGLNSTWICLKPGLLYHELPYLLKNYDVGVVLYNGHIPNVVFSSPNKVFEYLACGLDVWIPNVMIGSRWLVTESTYPRVLQTNFMNLKNFELNSAISRVNMTLHTNQYTCDDILHGFVDKIVGKQNNHPPEVNAR